MLGASLSRDVPGDGRADDLDPLQIAFAHPRLGASFR